MGMLKKKVNDISIVTSDVHDVVNIICSHIQGVCLEYNNIIRVYPTLTTEPPTVYAGLTPMTLGDSTIIVPANTITKNFRVKHINIGDVSSRDTYEIHLFANSILIGYGRFIKDNTISSSITIEMSSGIIAANSQVTATLASIKGGGNVRVSIAYKQADMEM